MAKIYSEAKQDLATKLWGISVVHEVDGQLLEPIYVFPTRKEAKDEIVRLLCNLKQLADDSKSEGE